MYSFISTFSAGAIDVFKCEPTVGKFDDVFFLDRTSDKSLVVFPQTHWHTRCRPRTIRMESDEEAF